MPAIADHLLAGSDTQQASGTQPEAVCGLHKRTHTQTHSLRAQLSVFLGDESLKMLQEDVSAYPHSALPTHADRTNI